MSLPSRYLFPVSVDAEGLSCRRGDRVVFRQVGFTLHPGEMLALIGPNGSGKTSLLRIVAGLLEPDAGSLAIRSGREEDEASPRSLHYLGHLDALKPALSLAENLRFWSVLCGTAEVSREAILAATTAVGLGDLAHFPAGILSAGQRRRAGLARLLVSPKPLWLLDEPTSALDAEGESLLGTLLRRHMEAGGSVLAATHVPLPMPPTGLLQFGAAA